MFERTKERIKKDQLANDLIELGHQIKRTNASVSVNTSSTVGVAATKTLQLIASIEHHLAELIKNKLTPHDDEI